LFGKVSDVSDVAVDVSDAAAHLHRCDTRELSHERRDRRVAVGS
jgi:hypothetical protein